MNNNLRILDTDALSQLQRKPEDITPYLQSFPSEQVATTIITVYESLRGWLNVVNKAKTSDSYVNAFTQLLQFLRLLRKINILPFDKCAATKFDEFTPEQKRKGTMDSLIAAIALSVNGIVVTQNRKHFSQVSGLKIESWQAPLNRTERNKGAFGLGEKNK